MSDLQKNDRTEELSDEELRQIFGGINPQPLPPSHEINAGQRLPDAGFPIF
jgi:hypothetical protein